MNESYKKLFNTDNLKAQLGRGRGGFRVAQLVRLYLILQFWSVTGSHLVHLKKKKIKM